MKLTLQGLARIKRLIDAYESLQEHEKDVFITLIQKVQNEGPEAGREWFKNKLQEDGLI